MESFRLNQTIKLRECKIKCVSFVTGNLHTLFYTPQDGCIIHTDQGYPVHIGEEVTVGHRAILHGCTVKDGALIGMGAIVMNGAVIGENAVVAAGAVVTENAEVPAGAVVVGMPAKVRRNLSEEEIAYARIRAEEYIMLAKTQLSLEE